MTTHLQAFVVDAKRQIKGFDEQNVECIREIVRKSMAFYQMKSYEEVEETQFGRVHSLHLHSMMEENVLAKVVKLAMNQEEGLSLEELYNSHISRHY
ncbi:DUF6407 family protein [Halalkalibacter krulwichiae]|uniref:Uncharacterized protein n=1 Tax=Halalkalibacter krulwichiae TaxID=199441 RepID=A0A1X9MH71_9BACI|nr:DUF6407 family protein [Halalkalibacter krulwichiae]ARK29782.1 hypothetical protein BkAM31D_07870 [Halalkalibacter krulwichiae]